MSSESQKDDNLYCGDWNKLFVGHHKGSAFHFLLFTFHCVALFLILNACSTTRHAYSAGIFY